MSSHALKLGRRTKRPKAQERPTPRTLVLLLPRFYNPDSTGSRRKIELHKWKMTIREIEQIFPGHQRFRVKGWNHEDNVRDHLYRFEADVLITREKVSLLRRWKRVLARRFEQREIYIKRSEKVTWL
jgi:hypothetical protein